MTFIKGYKMTEEHKRKIGLANSISLKGCTPWNKGKSKLTDKRVNYLRPTTFKNGHPKPQNGYSFGCGENHPLWKNGISVKTRGIRASKEYQNWRGLVFERDNYTCQICDKRGGTIHANHIKKFISYPELQLFNLNGITLCKDCHSVVTNHESEWESYFNFNLMTRGFLIDGTE